MDPAHQVRERDLVRRRLDLLAFPRALGGVGGFLGLGELDVMVPLNQLRFSNEHSSTTGSASDADRKWYPDRAVLNANKDQLKQMPEFKY